MKKIEADNNFTADYIMWAHGNVYKFKFVCAYCGEGYTTEWASAPSESAAKETAANEARIYFNRCHKCGAWICDRHYNLDDMTCVNCNHSL